RAETPPGVAVEVLVKEYEILEVRVGREARRIPVARATSGLVAQEQRRQARADRPRHLAQREALSGSGRILDREAVAIEVVVALERLHQEEVEREPDRAAPVGVAAEQAGPRLRGCVLHAMFGAADAEDVGVLLVVARHRANAVRREELLLVE